MYSYTTILPLLNMICMFPGPVFMHILGMLCSPYQPFVVVLFFKSKISSFALNFECCNFDNVVYAQTATLHTN